MPERTSILEEIRSGGYEASLITTFNAYLPFYEDVVLRHLMGGGVRHNVLMMDATQTALAVDQHPPHSVGRYYTLAPIKVAGAFHPKVIFLVGKKKGTLLVGSHNLTLSGFGYNREMTNVIRYRGDADLEGAALLGSAWQYVLDWATSQANTLPAHILDMIRKVADFAPWLKENQVDAPDHCRILAANPESPGLWQQLKEFVGTGPVNRVVVSGAFFDARLAFIEKLRDDLAPKELYVGIDPASVQLPAGKELPGVTFVNAEKLGATEKEKDRTGYLHAKSIAIHKEDGETVLAVGSANPSHPAWLAPGVSQNIEMMIVRKGEEARLAAEDLGLFKVPAMPVVAEEDWQKIKENWRRFESSSENPLAAQVVIALASEAEIRFKVSAADLPADLECELFASTQEQSIKRHARLAGSEYVLPAEGLPGQVVRFRFSLSGRPFTGLVQHTRQIEGLSRTGSQRRLSEALASLSTGAPNLDDFVECIKEIIKINDSVTSTKSASRVLGTRGKEEASGQKEGAALSIGQAEVAEQEQARKQRLRGSDDLGYLLDVLLYSLRDEVTVGLDDALEERDAKGRSEEEQVNEDDDDVDPNVPPVEDEDQKSEPRVRDPLPVCHNKVSSLVDSACDKLESLKKGRLELAQIVVILAGVLSALRLLRGLEGKVPWIGAGQTAVPFASRRKLFNKVAEVLYDGDFSIISLGPKHSQLSEFDEFARLKGLIIWLAWDSEIRFAGPKPFNESLDECNVRRGINRLYVATAQLIAGDGDVSNEARQSIGQLGLGNLDWLDRLMAVDTMIRDVCGDPGRAENCASAKAGDFGFNSLNPALGVREIFPRGMDKQALSGVISENPRFVFPKNIIRAIPFEWILKK